MAFGVKVKLDVELANASKLRSQIQQAVENATQNKPVKIRHLAVDLGRQEAQRISKQLESAIASQDLTIKIAKIDASKPVANLKKQLTTMLSGLSITGLKDFLGTDGVGDSYDKAAAAANRLAEAQGNIRRKTEEANAAMKTLKSVQSTLNNVFKSTTTVGDQAKLKEYLNKYRELLAASEAAKNMSGEAQSAEVMRITVATVALKKEVDAQLEAERAANKRAATEKSAEEISRQAAAERERAAKKEANTSRQAIQLRQRINTWIQSNSKAYAANKMAIDTLMSSLQNDAAVSDVALAQIRKRFEEINASARASGIAGKSFFDTLKAGWAKFGGWSLVTKSMMAAINTVKNMVRAVITLDAAMTELRKVTDLSSQSYINFADKAAQTAKRVGASVSDTINATADFSRLGYNIDDAAALAEAALIYKNVGDGIDDISVATESLISTLKAFGIEANNAMSIVDMFNEVGNNFAISSSGIGEALQRSASALAAAGNTLEQSIGLITAMNSVVQNPEAVGTSLKTLTMFLRAAKTEAEEAGIETEGMANSVSELRAELKSLTGVDIMVDDDTFKSTYQIIQEIASVWDGLKDVTQSNVLNLIGGKRNANVIASLITNFKDAENAMKSAMNSLGSATSENEKYVDSINGKIAILKASFEEMSSSIINSAIIKVVLDIASGIMSAVTWLAKAKALLPVITASVIAIRGAMDGIKAGNAIDVVTGALKNKSFDDATNIAAMVTEKLSNAQKNQVSSMLAAKVAAGELDEVLAEQILSVMGLTEAFQMGSGASGKFASAIRGIGTALKSWQTILFAIEVVIFAVSRAIDEHNKKIQETIDRANEVSEAYSSAQNTYRNNVKALEELRSQYEYLSAGVDDNGKNIGLTANEYETYLSIVDRIIDISPSVVDGYSNEGIAITNYKGLIDDAVESQEEYIKNQTAIHLSQRDTLFNGMQAQLAKAQESSADKVEDLGWAFYDLRKEIFGFFADASQLSDALDEFGSKYGIENLENLNTQSISYLTDEMLDAAMLLYDKRSEFMNYLVESYDIDPNGELYDRINQSIMAFAEIPPEIQQATNVWREYLNTFIQSEDQNAWYGMIPENARDEFLSGIDEMCSGFALIGVDAKSAEDAVVKFGTEFANAIGSDSVNEIVNLSKGLSDGSVTIDKYDAAVETFLKSYENMPLVVAMVGSYLRSLSNEYVRSKEAADNASRSTKGFMVAMESLSKGYDILAKAEADIIGSGGLSIDTLASMQSLMEDGEKITDYLTVENGLLKLNSGAWVERSEKMALNDISAIILQIEDLEKANAALSDTPENALLNAEEIKKNADQIAMLTGLLELYQAQYNKIVNDSKDPDLSTMISGLDSIGSKASGLLDTLNELENGTAMSAGEVANLALQYGELFGMSPDYDLTTLEGQKSAIEAIIAAYEDEFDAIIDTQIASLETAKAREELTDSEIADIDAKIARLTALKELELGDIFGDTGELVELSQKYSDMLSALKSNSNYGGYTQITYEDYQSLIEADKRYAAAIEYQNGVMVLNGAKHDEITSKILEETKAMALHEKQTILMSEDYQDLKRRFDAGLLTDEEDNQRFLDLEAQIRGFDILATEIDGATSAYYRWLNRKGDDGMDRYSQATQAFELIDDTLNDKKSEYYGRIGREEFGLAVDFVLGEHVELNTPEFDRAMKLAKRYLTDGAEGAANFYDDLVNAGLMDATTGALDSTIAEIAKSLGISEEMVRTMIDRLNEYQDEANKIEVAEPEVKTEETESALEQVITSLESANEYINTIRDTPLLIAIQDEEKTTSELTNFKGMLEGIATNLLSILQNPLSFNIDELTTASQRIAEYISNIQGAVEDVNGIELDVDASESESSLESLNSIAITVIESVTAISNILSAIVDARNDINSTGINIRTGRTPLMLGVVSGKLSSIINQLAKIKANSNITVRINEVTTKTTKARGFLSGVFGKAAVSGNAAARGTAMASGGKTLVGELGMETVVDPASNTWYTVGERGAEFVNLPKNAIVFNHKQTKELFGTGHIDSRGDAMATGNAAASFASAISNAFAELKNIKSNIKNTLKTSDPTKGSGTQRPKVSGSGSGGSGNKGSGGGGGGSKDEKTELEELKEQYEELNKQTEHLIAHQEFLYKQAEKGIDYSGMDKSLQAQVELYKKIMSDSQAAVAEMIANGADDTSEELQSMEEAYWSAYESLYETLDKINGLYVDALNEKIDGIQSAFDNLQTAADEFNKYGGITLDSFQSLLENGVQYMSLLENQNGQYIINTEGIQKLIAAQKEQLAVESAISYLKQLQTALADGEVNAVANLVNLTNQLSSTTWDAVYAQAALLRANLSEEQYAKVIANIDALRAISNSVITDISKRLDDTDTSRKESIDGQQDALEKILELTEDLIKAEAEDRIEAIEDEIDAYKKIINLKKESLKASKDENDYAKSVAEKTKEIGKLQARIDMLKLDDSREARAERAKLEEQLAGLQGDLGDLQSDHAYDIQTDALDKAADAFEEARKQEIDAIENSISSAEKLYRAALSRLESGWSTLYQELIEWNTEAGSSLNSEIIENWEKAAEAVKVYGSYVQAVAGIKAEQESFDAGSESSSNNIVAVGTPTEIPPKEEAVITPPTTPEPDPEPAPQPVQKVHVVSGRWNVRTGPSSKYKTLGVVGEGTKLEYRGTTSGKWYAVKYNGKDAWINNGGSKLIEELPKYHVGGIAGDKATEKDNEVLSVLEKGEMVLTDKMKRAAYTLIDFKDYLEKKLGNAIGAIYPPVSQIPVLSGVGVSERNAIEVGKIDFSPTFQVEINHSGTMTDKDARQYGKTIAGTAANELYEGFRKRGIGKIFGTKPTK